MILFFVMVELRNFFEELGEVVSLILDKCGEMISGSTKSNLIHLDADISTLKEKIPEMFRGEKSREIIAVVELLSKKLDKINKDELLKRNKDVVTLLKLLNSNWNKLLGEIIKMAPKIERKAKAKKIIARLERFFKKGK